MAKAQQASAVAGSPKGGGGEGGHLFANLAGYAFNVLVTFGLGVLGWFDRPTNSELSEKYQTIVTPAGVAFAIWSIIFMTQALWVLGPLLIPSQRQAIGIQTVGLKYLYVCLAQAGWTVAFCWEVIWLSLLFMYLILFFLAWIVYEQEALGKNWNEYFMHQFPFSLHCGWIIAASGVNTNVLLVSYGASGQVQLITASLTLIILSLTGFVVVRKTNDLTIPCVLIWALYWIFSELVSPRQQIVDTFNVTGIQSIQNLCIAGASTLAIIVLVRAISTCCIRSTPKPKAK